MSNLNYKRRTVVHVRKWCVQKTASLLRLALVFKTWKFTAPASEHFTWLKDASEAGRALCRSKPGFYRETVAWKMSSVATISIRSANRWWSMDALMWRGAAEQMQSTTTWSPIGARGGRGSCGAAGAGVKCLSGWSAPAPTLNPSKQQSEPWCFLFF